MITAEMRALIAAMRLSYVATTCADGTPNLSPKGSLMVWDDQHLVFADIASPQTIANLEANPAVEVNVLDPFSRRGFRFKGAATILRAGPEVDSLRSDIARRFDAVISVCGAVKIRVEAVRPLLSPSYPFDEHADEAEIRREWMANYGVAPAWDGMRRRTGW